MEISGSRLANRSGSIRQWRLELGEADGGGCEVRRPTGAQPVLEQRIDDRRHAMSGNTRAARLCLGIGDVPSTGTC
jgi:hypothetical protein